MRLRDEVAAITAQAEKIREIHEEIKALNAQTAISYLGYVLMRSEQSAQVLRSRLGAVADLFEARYQAEIQEGADEWELDQARGAFGEGK